MADARIRHQIAFLAAQMMYRRSESEYFTAKRKAAKRLGIEYRHRPGDLPSNFKSSITGKAIERASIAELEALLREENPELNLDEELERLEDHIDPFTLFRMLLLPLEGVKQSPKYHPEGDALYHSLQVFELARQERPYDEEFLLGALLHDVGKAIDPSDHVAAALQALEGSITERTASLIAHHMDAQSLRAGTLPAKARARLQRSEYYDDLMLLADLDRRGRVPGAVVCEPDEALEFIRELAEQAEDA